MKKQDITYNDTVKEALAIALLKLMEQKNLMQISISEIVNKAGVSRSSFYRNFNSKEEILIDYIEKRYRSYFKTLSLSENDIQLFLYHRLHFIKQNKIFFICLRKNNLLNYLFEEMDPDLASYLSGKQIFASPYHKAMFTSCSAGIIRQWIDNNFKESEEELLDLQISISTNFKGN